MKFKPTDDQRKCLDLLETDVRAVWLRAGRGAGKTTLGAHWLTKLLEIYPENRALITACSYPQLERSTLVGLAHYCQKHGIKLHPTANTVEATGRLIAVRRHCYINGKYVYVVSADNFYGGTESARGMEVRIIWADELAYYAESFDTLNSILGRGPGQGGKMLITSTINKHNPYNRLWEIFDDPEKVSLLYKSCCARSQNNPHLDKGYVDALYASFTQEQIDIELEGEYAVMTEGKLFLFNRTEHFITDSRFYDWKQYKRLALSFDFNFSPSTCLIGYEGEEQILVLREFYIENCGTFKLAERVADYIESLGIKEVELFGDASGLQRTANSKKSNWDIIFEEFGKRNIKYYRRFRLSNPSIIDSVNYTNSLFNKGLLQISPDCRELIKDLETCRWDKNNKIDKLDLKRGHLADCLRYLTWQRSPLYHRDYIPKSSFL